MTLRRRIECDWKRGDGCDEDVIPTDEDRPADNEWVTLNDTDSKERHYCPKHGLLIVSFSAGGKVFSNMIGKTIDELSSTHDRFDKIKNELKDAIPEVLDDL